MKKMFLTLTSLILLMMFSACTLADDGSSDENNNNSGDSENPTECLLLNIIYPEFHKQQKPWLTQQTTLTYVQF